MCLFKKQNKQEQTRILANRKYRYLTTNSKLSTKGHELYKTELIISLVHSSGQFELHIFDSSNNEVFSLINPETNQYIFALKPNGKYLINIKSKSAIGSYKIEKKIYK